MTLVSGRLTRQTFDDRRGSVRFPTNGRLLGHVLALDLPVRIRDLSFGGCSVETMEPLAPGTTVDIRFTAIDDSTSVLTATSVHTRPSCASDGSPRYVTGFVFAGERSAVIASVAALMNSIMAPAIVPDAPL